MRGYRGPCKAVNVGDQWICDRCNLAWDTSDPDVPDCLSDASLKDQLDAPRSVEEYLATPSDEDLLRRKEEACNTSEPCECHCACMQKILEILENKE